MSAARLLVMALMVTVIGGCGAFPEPDTAGVNGGPESVTKDCNWTRKRGIAELMEVRDDTGLFHFHPDSIPVTQSVKPGWAVGDEFKVILITPESPECAAKRLIEITPLAPTD